MKPFSIAPMKVPDSLTPAIAGACDRLVPNGRPVFVNRRTAAGTVVNKCTFNVRKYLETNPGEMVLGWEITVWDKVMLDCIGHAVVLSDGELFCVSPSKYSDSKILFLPDPRLAFDFNDPMARMPTKQVSISSRPEVRRLIEVEEAEHAIKIRYPVAAGNILIGGSDAVSLQKLAREKQKLMLSVVLATSDHVSKCFCGSGKKFRKCHRSDVERALQLC